MHLQKVSQNTGVGAPLSSVHAATPIAAAAVREEASLAQAQTHALRVDKELPESMEVPACQWTTRFLFEQLDSNFDFHSPPRQRETSSLADVLSIASCCPGLSAAQLLYLRQCADLFSSFLRPSADWEAQLKRAAAVGLVRLVQKQHLQHPLLLFVMDAEAYALLNRRRHGAAGIADQAQGGK
eukprot:6199152-Pleurochrysis_carterae.AAC.1